MELIILIIIISVIVTNLKKKKSDEYEQARHKAKEIKNDLAGRQLHESHTKKNNTTILQRATANVEDDKISESTLGTIEDLMIKGYEGNLCFERDFLGEAMDMVTRFSLGGNVIDES